MSPNGGLIPHLYAMRVMLDGVVAQLDRVIEQLEFASSAPMHDQLDRPVCPHPPDRQVNASTMGGAPQIMCLVCGEQRAGSIEAQ